MAGQFGVSNLAAAPEAFLSEAVVDKRFASPEQGYIL